MNKDGKRMENGGDDALSVTFRRISCWAPRLRVTLRLRVDLAGLEMPRWIRRGADSAAKVFSKRSSHCCPSSERFRADFAADLKDFRPFSRIFKDFQGEIMGKSERPRGPSTSGSRWAASST